MKFLSFIFCNKLVNIYSWIDIAFNSGTVISRWIHNMKNNQPKQAMIDSLNKTLFNPIVQWILFWWLNGCGEFAVNSCTTVVFAAIVCMFLFPIVWCTVWLLCWRFPIHRWTIKWRNFCWNSTIAESHEKAGVSPKTMW